MQTWTGSRGHDAARWERIVRPDAHNGEPRDASRHTRRSLSVAKKVRDVLGVLADDRWVLDRTRGSHRQLKHPTKPGLVTIAGSGSDDLARGTLMSILKQAGLRNRGHE